MTRAVATAATTAALVCVAGVVAAPQLGERRADARQVLAQVRQLDVRLDLAVDAYNAAELRLDRIESDRRVNRRRLALARANYQRARRQLEQRLVSLYTQGEISELEILLGAASLDDFLDRVDTIARVSGQDVRIVHEVDRFQGEVRERGRRLARAEREQRELLAERSSQRAAIEGQLEQREQLLSTIRKEVARLEAEEAERQRRLVEQARQLREREPEAQPQDSVFVDPLPSDLPDSRFAGVVGIAMRYLGIPYRWGGSSPEGGFDCSGFVMYVFAQLGVSLPHNAAAQFGYGVPVPREALQPGDLVFFHGLGHNGIYVGDGLFIHSPHTGDVVKISSLSDPWYAGGWVGGRRL